MSFNSTGPAAETTPAVRKLNFLGRGTYGTVHRAVWKNRDVAVKEMEYSEDQKKAFENELSLFEKVKHKNIIKLLAHSVTDVNCSLIMEYAECSNLYDLLHQNTTEPMPYSMQHALSWSHQTAQALAYLHNLQPRPLVHRDVKPPNLLLMNFCRTIKICDFGTACDVHTHMTTNKGSAFWMAPEVFNSSHTNPNKSYTEKCDTFSFGITVWEIFARRKPFVDIWSPFAVMWAINGGTRPPLMQNCPQPLEELITRCWAQEPADRPSMSSVEKRLAQMSELVIREELPKIHLPQKPDRMARDGSFSEFTESLPFDTVTEPANRNPHLYSFLQGPTPNYQPFINTDPGGSQENLLDEGFVRRTRQPSERTPNDQSGFLTPLVPERRPRSSSFNNSVDQENRVNDLSASKFKSTTSALYDEVTPSSSRTPNFPHAHAYLATGMPSQDDGYRTGRNDIHSIQAYISQIEPKYRPLQPDTSNVKSMEIFNRHQEVCHKFMRLSTHLKLLQEREKEIDLMQSNGIFNFDLEKEIDDALSDKESLTKFRNNLQKQLEKILADKLSQEAEKDGFQLLG